ncbi:MAG: hypothetical protein RRY54_06900 [Angelakisella sp.]
MFITRKRGDLAVIVVNLENGMPSTESAMIQLRQSLLTARARRVKVLKLIHGYGSSGRGGSIRSAVRAELGRRKQSGQIQDYITGEEFSPFYENARRAVEAEPELRKDLDYARTNQGITIVVL